MARLAIIDPFEMDKYEDLIHSKEHGLENLVKSFDCCGHSFSFF